MIEFLIFIVFPVSVLLCASIIPKIMRPYKRYCDKQESMIEWTSYKSCSNAIMGTYYYPRYTRKQLSSFPTITFKQFVDFYNINPNSWTLCDYYVYKNSDHELSFTFTYPEWKKYKKFKAAIDKKAEEDRRIQEEIKTKNEQNEITIRILEEVQKDIKRVRAESQKNIQEAADLIKEVKL